MNWWIRIVSAFVASILFKLFLSFQHHLLIFLCLEPFSVDVCNYEFECDSVVSLSTDRYGTVSLCSSFCSSPPSLRVRVLVWHSVGGASLVFWCAKGWGSAPQQRIETTWRDREALCCLVLLLPTVCSCVDCFLLTFFLQHIGFEKRQKVLTFVFIWGCLHPHLLNKKHCNLSLLWT